MDETVLSFNPRQTLTGQPVNHKRQTDKPFVVTQKLEEILKAVYIYRFVTVADITKLLFSYPSSVKYAGKLLAKLSGGEDYQEGQYLYRFRMPDTGPGNKERIYTLGALGRSYVSEVLGFPVDWYFRPAKMRGRGYNVILHDLTLTHVLIGAEIFSRNQEEFKLQTLETQYTLGKQPVSVEIEEPSDTKTSRKTIKVIPDAWLSFGRYQNSTLSSFVPILLEVDRGTEYQENFKQRLQSRLVFIEPEGEYKRVFGTNAVKLTYVTTASQTRLQTIMRWTKEELKEQGKEEWASKFYFCSLPPGLEESKLFSDPVWVRLNEKRPTTLL